jgi:hypothetical protein
MIVKPNERNKRMPVEERRRRVAHELGHFYQAKRLLGINSDITFGWHYTDSAEIATRDVIRTPDGKCLVESVTHGDTFVFVLDGLVTEGLLRPGEATRYNFLRIVGGAEMEKAVCGGESIGEFDDLQLLHARMSQIQRSESDKRQLSEADRKALEDSLRDEVQQSLTPDVIQNVWHAVEVLSCDEYFHGRRTGGDVIQKILEGDT